MPGDIDYIKSELDLFSSKRGPAALIAVTVLNTNEDDSTVEVQLDGGATIDDVQLRSIVKDGGKVVLIPKQKSIVLIASINNSTEYYVVAVEEVEKIIYQIGESSYVLTGDGHVISKGSDLLWDGMKLLFESLEVIMVMQGNNPDFVKLAQAKAKIKNILNGT